MSPRYNYQRPLGKLPGRICAGLAGATGKLPGGFRGNSPPRVSPSRQAEAEADALFGEQARRLAEAEWQTSHAREAEE